MNISSCARDQCEASTPQEACPLRHGDDLDLTLKFVEDANDAPINVQGVIFEITFEHEPNMEVPDLVLSGKIPHDADALNGEVNITIPGEDTYALKAFPNYYVHTRITDTTGYTATLGTLIMKVY